MQKLWIVALAAVGPGLWGSVLGQTSFWDSRDAYRGQRLVGDTPRIRFEGSRWMEVGRRRCRSGR
ncbi:MAG TPA: hypothetical protein VNV35_15415 [Puia sp.]|nr:hypothetical protein [Puia sp.]